ncbi:MAG: hypothetical protein CL920_23890 [Deltaproteobacteria bacterium]|nr:hypothetical protein [Deltaproteobacteria bacterium]
MFIVHFITTVRNGTGSFFWLFVLLAVWMFACWMRLFVLLFRYRRDLKVAATKDYEEVARRVVDEEGDELLKPASVVEGVFVEVLDGRHPIRPPLDLLRLVDGRISPGFRALSHLRFITWTSQLVGSIVVVFGFIVGFSALDAATADQKSRLLAQFVGIGALLIGPMAGLMLAIAARASGAFFKQALLQLRSDWMRALFHAILAYRLDSEDKEHEGELDEELAFRTQPVSAFDRYALIGLLLFSLGGAYVMSKMPPPNQAHRPTVDLVDSKKRPLLRPIPERFAMLILPHKAAEERPEHKNLLIHDYLEWLHLRYPSIDLLPQDWHKCLDTHALGLWKKDLSLWQELRLQKHPVGRKARLYMKLHVVPDGLLKGLRVYERAGMPGDKALKTNAYKAIGDCLLKLLQTPRTYNNKDGQSVSGRATLFSPRTRPLSLDIPLSF